MGRPINIPWMSRRKIMDMKMSSIMKALKFNIVIKVYISLIIGLLCAANRFYLAYVQATHLINKTKRNVGRILLWL